MLSNVVNNSEFTTLFDQYRINAIVLKFIPRLNMVQVPTVVGQAPINNIPTLHWVYDYDDANAPSNVDELLQYNNYRCCNFDKTVTMKIKPRFSLAAYSGAFTSYKPASGWLDCASPSIQHYGVKFAVDSFTAGQFIDFIIRPIYYLSFRYVR